jgi:DNA-binding transcriptional MocR family regulator
MAQSHLIDLSGRQPQWPEMARHRWQLSHRAALGDGDVWSTPPHAGDSALRQTLGDILGDDPSNIVITTGVRATAFSLVRHGDIVFHECPSFTGTVYALQSAGAHVELHEWVRLAALSRRQKSRHFLWVTSPCRNPDGVSLPPALLADFSECQRGAATIVINETYRWYKDTGYAVPEAIHIGSLSKIASGGSRLGWIRGRDIGARFLPYHHVFPPMLWQRTWAYFLQDGGLELLLACTVRQAAAARRAFVDITSDVLPRADDTDGPSVLYFLPSTDEATAVAQCTAHGLVVGAGGDFLAPRPALRLCFTDIDPATAIIAGRRFLQAVQTWQ